MKNLAKVTYTYQSYPTSNYDGSKQERERMLFLDSDNYVNTHRLAGFEGASIEVKNIEVIREMNPIEILNYDIDKNSLMAAISVDHHLNSTTKKLQKLTETLENSELDFNEVLEKLGYQEICSDNTYNWCSDLENDLQFTVYDLEHNTDWLYSETAIIVVSEHSGLDVRAGYTFKGVYKSNDMDGFCYFLDTNIRATIISKDYEEVEQFDCNSSIYIALEKYKLVSVDEKNGEIIVKNENNEEFYLDLYSPACGV